ncbi:MAG: DUF3536 domain-containing protein [Sphaerochaetaceae bacterium]|nr:DUF3536 domain-containing protein [Sphaerochaetaceae bacterium]
MNTFTHDKTALIIHGHFYQPPRENPLSELIPSQSSAAPLANWNERVYSECYRMNAYSRYLDGYGHVSDIVNNYEYISFNFGPTLLNWMAAHHGRTYKRIIDADKTSEERLGHGNAIAQVYNHTILPLASERDSKIQIAWGVRDFEQRFSRKPEGIWLAETAVNARVIDDLLDADISYIILSPYQCNMIETANGDMKQVNAHEVPYWEPFLVEGSSKRTIPVFFYHPDLASSISFGHLLHDADAMYRTIRDIRDADNVPLINTATDGEIYGHHEPFGDMALAALVKKSCEKNDFTLTNYATYLSEHPASRKAILHLGEEGRGTSWSCSHGVSRWYKDCGCHTGGQEGWNQKWRTPLREAFDYLARRIDAAFDQEVAQLTDATIEPDRLLERYVDVMSNFVDTPEFFHTLENEGKIIRNRQRLAILLEGQKFKHFMYTSCGWFFNDLAGIEPKQNIMYAVQALNCYKENLSESDVKEFYRILSRAKSNRRNDGSGKSIALTCEKTVRGEIEATTYFILNRTFAQQKDRHHTYGKFTLTMLEVCENDPFCFSLHFNDTRTLVPYFVKAHIHIPDDHRGYTMDVSVRQSEEEEEITEHYDDSYLPLELIEEAYSWIDASMNTMSDEEMLRVARTIKYYTLLIRGKKNVASQTLFIETMGTSLSALRSLFTTPQTISWFEKRESIGDILRFIHLTGREMEHQTVVSIFSQEIERTAREIDTFGFNYQRGSYLLDVIRVARAQEYQPDITIAQESLREIIKGDGFHNLMTPLTRNLIDELRTELNFSA